MITISEVNQKVRKTIFIASCFLTLLRLSDINGCAWRNWNQMKSVVASDLNIFSLLRFLRLCIIQLYSCHSSYTSPHLSSTR